MAGVPYHHGWFLSRPDWLAALPSEQAREDATRVVFDIQRQARIDLPTDGELCRFDVNHPDTNGMIEYFVRPMYGIRTQLGAAIARSSRARTDAIPAQARGRGHRPAWRRRAQSAGRLRTGRAWLAVPFKFTVTSPYMLSRTLLDLHYGDFEEAHYGRGRRAGQSRCAVCRALACRWMRPISPAIPTMRRPAARAINAVLDAVTSKLRAVHLCFGNYGGQTIQKGAWAKADGFPEFASRRSCGSRTGAASAAGTGSAERCRTAGSSLESA